MKTNSVNRLLFVALAVIIGTTSQIEQLQPPKSSGPLAVLRTTPQVQPVLSTTTAQVFPPKNLYKLRYVLIGDSIVWNDQEMFKKIEGEITSRDPHAEFFKCGKPFRHLIKQGHCDKEDCSLQHDTENFHQCVLSSNADVYVVMLGSNDAKWGKWNPFDFVNDYTELCKFMKDQESEPKVYLVIPPPFYPQFGKTEVDPDVVNTYLPELIPRVGKQCKLPEDQVIDAFEPLGGSALNKQELMCDRNGKQKCDGFHPSPEGYQVMAKVILNGLLK